MIIKSIIRVVTLIFFLLSTFPIEALENSVPLIHSPSLSNPYRKKVVVPSLELGGDCGPKVLKEILGTMEQNISLEELIKITDTTKGQTSLSGLRNGAQSLGLLALGIKSNTENLEEILNQGYFVIGHVGGNKHYVWIKEVDEKWVKGFNPAVSAKNWKIPRKIFEKMWKGEALVIKTVDSQQSMVDSIKKKDFVFLWTMDCRLWTSFIRSGVIEFLPESRMNTIWGGETCANSYCDGGEQKGGTKTGEPVELSNGDLVMGAKDIGIEAVGPDLVLERTYHTQIFSDIEGWTPDDGTGSWSVENGWYAGAGDRSLADNQWENVSVSLKMQTIGTWAKDYHVAWVNVRYVDEQNRYYFLMKTTGILELTKFKGGVQSFLVSKASSYSPLNSHSIQIEAKGAKIKIWVDGNLEIAYTDQDPISGVGHVVLESYYCHAHYDDITIRDLDTDQTQTWNFNEDDNDGMFGRNWRASIEVNLIFRENGDIWIRQGNDRRDKYVWDSLTSTWLSPDGSYETLTQTDSGYTLREKDGILTQFDNAGRLNSLQDRHSNTLTFAYTSIAGKERISQITEEKGRTLTLSYDENAHCLQAVDPIGRTTSYHYNANGQLESSIDARGNTRSYSYDEHYRMNQYRDRNAHLYQYQYSYNNRTLFQTDPEGRITTFDYLWEVTQVTDAGGGVWTYEFDWASKLISQIDAEGNEKLYNWDMDYNLLSHTDPKGNITQASYDPSGNRISQTDALGNTATASYESTYSLPTSATDRRGNTSTLTYDSEGNLIQATDPLGYTQTMTYNNQGQIATFTDKRGNTTTYSYDSYGNLNTVTDAQGNITDYDYDPAGRLIQEKNALGKITSYQYDENSNLISITDPLGHVTNANYDANDNKTEITDPLGNITTIEYNTYDKPQNITDPLGRITTYTYNTDRFMLTGAVDMIQTQDPQGGITDHTLDKIGRIKQKEDALGNVSQYQYDKNGNPTQITDSKGNITTYSFDSINRLITTTYANGKTETLTYDVDSNVIQKKLRDASTISYTYNSRNEMTQRTTSDGTTDVYSYDANGNTMQIQRNGTSTWTYSYDTLNRITQTTDSAGRIIKYSYDALGRRTLLTYPDNTLINYTYNEDNLLTQIKEGSTTLATYTYDASHRRTAKKLGNSVTSTYGYDSANELTSLITQKSATPLSSYNYTYDNLSNRLTQTDLTGTHNYSYDAISEITQAKYSSGIQQDYTYDAVQNRTLLTQGSANTSYTLNNLNQITSSLTGSTTTTYTWDTRANLNKKVTGTNTTTYTHNKLNQLTKITQTGKSAVSATYDPLGRRITKTVGATTTKFSWDGDQLIEVRNSAGTVQRKFIYGVGIDEPLVLKSGSIRYYYTTDGLGSISELTNSSGSKIESYRYDIYGKPTVYNSSGTVITKSSYNNPYSFTGREYDSETGLYYYRARTYDPALGRFVE
ncbi:MAG: hypothetical protein HYS08_01830 [Chlamydiae bacterium]|nr:hypothetical protein [Chlamydiota bacterium]